MIERHDNYILIALPGMGSAEPGGSTTTYATPGEAASAAGATRVWQFPRGLATPQESAEAAMRRVACEQLGVDVEIIVGQPPLVQTIDGREVEMRYFFCGVIDEPRTGHYAELRWIPKSQLREYDFDAPSAEVVQWLLET
jgi:ADP-ribose pyrophosphatase YjhB (NUDIX family)